MTASITPDERAAMRALADAATPGPWRRDWYAGVVEPKSRLMTAHEGYNHSLAEYLTETDARFIAAARTDVPRLLDALDTAEAEIEAAQRQHNAAFETVAASARETAQAAKAWEAQAHKTLDQRDEARAEVARVHEAAARCVADEAAESDLTITRQRDRLRAREEQVRRLRAEVTRLHALVATERAARPAPVWDEDTVRAEAKSAVTELESDYDFEFGPLPGEDAYVDAVLAVVREHLPVSGESRATAARAWDEGFHGAEEQHDGYTGVSGWTNNNPYREGDST